MSRYPLSAERLKDLEDGFAWFKPRSFLGPLWRCTGLVEFTGYDKHGNVISRQKTVIDDFGDLHFIEVFA